MDMPIPQEGGYPALKDKMLLDPSRHYAAGTAYNVHGEKMLLVNIEAHRMTFERTYTKTFTNEVKTGKRGDSRYTPKLVSRYPNYYFEVPTGVSHMDIYALMRMIKLNDPILGHAFKKVGLSGVRTGGKSALKDIIEARDTLNRWIEMEGGEDEGEEA